LFGFFLKAHAHPTLTKTTPPARQRRDESESEEEVEEEVEEVEEEEEGEGEEFDGMSEEQYQAELKHRVAAKLAELRKQKEEEQAKLEEELWQAEMARCVQVFFIVDFFLISPPLFVDGCLMNRRTDGGGCVLPEIGTGRIG